MKAHSLIAVALIAAPASALAAEPEPTPEPAPELTPTLGPEATLIEVEPAAVPVPEDYNRFEISVTSELHWLVQSSARVTSEAPSQGSFVTRLSYSPIELLDLYVGYRSLYEVSRDDKGYALSTDGDAALFGARVRYPLLRWLSLTGNVDLEALHLEHDLAVGERSGSTGEWTFGVVPTAGVEFNLDLGGWEGLIRIEGGYAFRGPAAVDDMRLTSDASEVVPVDLGTTDLSGPVFGLTFGIRF